MKTVFIIHGWDGTPESDWYPWLKRELKIKGFKVILPEMPNPDEPKIETWLNFLRKLIKNPDKDTYLIGHSIGCQAILRYLETLPESKKICGAIFVAGWFNLINLETEEEKEIAKPWIETPIDFEKAKKTTNNFIAVFSDNDPYVTLDNSKIFKEKLNAKIIIEKNKGHFTLDNGVKELPIVLEELLKISKQ